MIEFELSGDVQPVLSTESISETLPKMMTNISELSHINI